MDDAGAHARRPAGSAVLSKAKRGSAEPIPFLPRMQWPELVNVASGERRDVTLFDGTVVDSASEAWRAECEARRVLALPSRAHRLDYLARVEKRRGADSRAALEALGLALWQAMRAAG